jgi:membrane complex biogenesis BtpA family protein
VIPPLIGMVHLGPLPGAPGFDGDFEAIVTAAVSDAGILADAGFDGLMIENFGDAPFFADDVPKLTVAAMTAAVGAVAAAVDLPIGVNILRNDALAALAVAAATGASFIRVNVLSGVMSTDQGVITGRAAEVARLRSRLGSDVAVAADVFVKHAAPPPGLTIEQAAVDTFERAGADALIVSGSGTGRGTPPDAVAAVKRGAPEAPVFIGSGADAATIASLLAVADGAIVGTSIKVDGVTTAPVDPDRARALVAAARG